MYGSIRSHRKPQLPHLHVNYAPVPHDHDVFLWPDGSWCYREHFAQLSDKRADFEVIGADIEPGSRWDCFFGDLFDRESNEVVRVRPRG